MRTFQAHIDESGNTGLDLFGDIKQPFFWTGTIVIEESSKYPHDLQDLAESVGEHELHGNKLGIRKIDQIGEKLIEIIESIDARFHFTRTEKKHIPTMRFVDAILDNVNNPAVGHLHYQITMMRKMIAAKIDLFFDEQDKIDFWAIHLSGDINKFKAFLRKFRLKISNKYPLSDRRGKFLILDALEWGIRHPAELLAERVSRPEGVQDFRSLQYESPNLVSVSMLLSGLHNLGDEYGRKVSKIVHDEQSEFGQYLQQMYQYFKGVKIQDPLNIFPTVEETDMFPDKLEFSTSSSSPHLQLVDICMWLLKQKIDNNKDIHGVAGTLLEKIINRSTISHFSSDYLRAEATHYMQQLMSMPIPLETLNQARKVTFELDDERKKKLNENW